MSKGRKPPSVPALTDPDIAHLKWIQGNSTELARTRLRSIVSTDAAPLSSKKKTRNHPGLPHATKPLSTCSQPEASGRMKRPQTRCIRTIQHTNLSWSSYTTAARPVHTRLALSRWVIRSRLKPPSPTPRAAGGILAAHVVCKGAR